MNNFQQEKEKLTTALNNLKVSNNIEKAEADLERHIGFEKEKKTFLGHFKVYAMTQGRFWPERKVICYSSAPGMGKTTFVKNLAGAMGRGLQPISLAGFKESQEYSILGDDKKPSLVAWAIKEQGSKNPVILLDELEKVEDKEIQKHLIQLFQDYKKGKKFTDKYYQTEIDLSHVTFFATVNYIDDLDMKLKNEIDITELPDFTSEEKKKILKMKAKEINDKHSEKKGGIISEEIIEEILKQIKEVGIRQAERALYKVEQEYIHTKNNGEKFTATENPHEWVKKKIFPYQEEFKATWKHKFLFALLGLNFVLFASWIFRRFIIKKTSWKLRNIMNIISEQINKTLESKIEVKKK